MLYTYKDWPFLSISVVGTLSALLRSRVREGIEVPRPFGVCEHDKVICVRFGPYL